MPPVDSGAASFFGNLDPDKGSDIEHAVQLSEAALEKRAVHTVMKKFKLIPVMEWGTKSERLTRFALFDESFPHFPVRLGTRRIRAKSMAAPKRRSQDLAFHEMTPAQLFRMEEFKKSQPFRRWEDLKDDCSIDNRPVGLVFPCVSTLFILHDWAYCEAPSGSMSLHVTRPNCRVELFDVFLDTVEALGWSPNM